MPPNVRAPSRISRAPRYRCLFIILLLCQSTLGEESTPPATGPKKQAKAWAQAANKQLDAMDVRIARLSNMQLQLAQLGLPPSDPKALSDYRFRKSELHFDIRDEEISLRLDVYTLWFL